MRIRRRTRRRSGVVEEEDYEEILIHFINCACILSLAPVPFRRAEKTVSTGHGAYNTSSQ